jgi:hypothetical protein
LKRKQKGLGESPSEPTSNTQNIINSFFFPPLIEITKALIPLGGYASFRRSSLYWGVTSSFRRSSMNNTDYFFALLTFLSERLLVHHFDSHTSSNLDAYRRTGSQRSILTEPIKNGFWDFFFWNTKKIQEHIQIKTH